MGYANSWSQLTAGGAVPKLVDRPEPELLGIYLNDHLAGSVAGGELAQRLLAAFRGKPAEPALRVFVQQVQEDRASLLRIMAALGVPVRCYKTAAAWLLEKVARLKPNGHLLRRSPLSTVVELEAMCLGVAGKGAGWRTLRVIADSDARLDPGELDLLLARASSQADLLEELRTAAAAEAFGAVEGVAH
jgi:hypothetical protein